MSSTQHPPQQQLPVVVSAKSNVEEEEESTTRNHHHDEVQAYYGTTLQTSRDLQTNACTTSRAPPFYIQHCLRHIHEAVLARYYGCGLCVPAYDLTGCTILDVGCGAGRDVYIASQLVGPTGTVLGVDMTHSQLDVARQYQSYHADVFGYHNTDFVHGYLEQLDTLPALTPNSIDVIISNCVLNLCPDKGAVLHACYTLLKPGGEMYFSDVYATRRVPRVLQENAILWGECISGALYWNDFHTLAKRAGFADPRLVNDAPIRLLDNNPKLQNAVTLHGGDSLQFYSATYRLLKLEELEPACEDYGQAVRYKGTIQLLTEKTSSSWTLDKHHVFETGKVVPVCGNTYRMLHDNPRAKDHFDFYGSWDRHYGIFEGCGSSLPFDQDKGSSSRASTSSSGSGSGSGKCC